jgi:hypothetical protein
VNDPPPGLGSGRQHAVRRYHRLRLLARVFFLAGCGLILVPSGVVKNSPELMSPILRDVAATLGLVLLLSVFPLYRLAVNRCPVCRRSFSDAPEYARCSTLSVHCRVSFLSHFARRGRVTADKSPVS